MKTITVSDDVWKSLHSIKLDDGHASIDEVLKSLLGDDLVE